MRSNVSFGVDYLPGNRFVYPWGFRICPRSNAPSLVSNRLQNEKTATGLAFGRDGRGSRLSKIALLGAANRRFWANRL